jgi:hypothetical protein
LQVNKNLPFFSDYETVAKFLRGEGERFLGEHKVRPYVKNIHLIEKWYYHKSPVLPSRDFRRGLRLETPDLASKGLQDPVVAADLQMTGEYATFCYISRLLGIYEG